MPVVKCEHCGDVPTYTPQFHVEGLDWCVWCMHANGQITEQQLERICSESESN